MSYLDQGSLVRRGALVLGLLLTGCTSQKQNEVVSSAPVTPEQPAEFTETPYEVIRANPDGSQVVQIEVMQVNFTESRLRHVDDNSGESAEEFYSVLYPALELHRMTVPAGQEVLEFLDQRYSPMGEGSFAGVFVEEGSAAVGGAVAKGGSAEYSPIRPAASGPVRRDISAPVPPAPVVAP